MSRTYDKPPPPIKECNECIDGPYDCDSCGRVWAKEIDKLREIEDAINDARLRHETCACSWCQKVRSLVKKEI